MKSITQYILLLLSILLLDSCAKDERLMYQQDARIYFDSYTNDPDSVNYSFGIRSADVNTDTVYLLMRTMGNATDYDREIALKLSATSTAKAGYHFSLGPLVVPAGAYQVSIPVYLYKKPGMKDSIITAEFEVAGSKDFQPGYDDLLGRSTTKTRLYYKVSVDDQVLKPANWDGVLLPKFGSFSVVKYKFMIEVTGKVKWNVNILPSEMNYLVQQVHLALYEYKQAHGPMLDENGREIVLP